MPEIMDCPNCGRQTYEGAARCSQCGEVLDAEADKKLKEQEELSRYGGFFLRGVAWLIDELLVALPFLLVFGLGFLLGIDNTFFYDKEVTVSEAKMKIEYSPSIPFLALFIVTWWIYDALMTSSSYQATMGKKLLYLKITDVEGNRLSFLRATGRYFARIASWFLGFGILMVAFTKRKRGLHDFLAKTVVVRQT